MSDDEKRVTPERKPMQAETTQEKTARLKALRLQKEAADVAAEAANPVPPKPVRKRAVKKAV